jgi:hypothetical protein
MSKLKFEFECFLHLFILILCWSCYRTQFNFFEIKNVKEIKVQIQMLNWEASYNETLLILLQ